MALVFGLTVVGLTSCDDDLLSQEDSFTLTGDEFHKEGGDYLYIFENFSHYDVKITIDDVTQTIKRFNYSTELGGVNTSRLEVKNSSKTITVTYSPSNSVRYARDYWMGENEVDFWDK